MSEITISLLALLTLVVYLRHRKQDPANTHLDDITVSALKPNKKISHDTIIPEGYIHSNSNFEKLVESISNQVKAVNIVITDLKFDEMYWWFCFEYEKRLYKLLYSRRDNCLILMQDQKELFCSNRLESLQSQTVVSFINEKLE